MHRLAFGTFRMLALATLWALAGMSGSAHAEPAKTAADTEAVIASAEYKALIREGMLRYTRGLWDEARAFFHKAHELAPNARTLRGLALISYDSKRFASAIDYGEQSLAHPVQPLTDKMKEELKNLLDQAQRQVARAELIVRPADAEVRVDGALVDRRADGRLWLDPGAHQLSVSAPGYRSETRSLQLGEQQSARLEVTLSSLHPIASARLASTEDKREPTSATLPWIVTGLSLGVAVAGGAILIVDQNNGGSGWSPLGAALLGVGAAGAIVGTTWALWPRDKERATSARLSISPLAIQCSGTF